MHAGRLLHSNQPSPPQLHSTQLQSPPPAAPNLNYSCCNRSSRASPAQPSPDHQLLTAADSQLPPPSSPPPFTWSPHPQPSNSMDHLTPSRRMDHPRTRREIWEGAPVAANAMQWSAAVQWSGVEWSGVEPTHHNQQQQRQARERER
jgi:hypothetical protein